VRLVRVLGHDPKDVAEELALFAYNSQNERSLGNLRDIVSRFKTRIMER
jgi:hypothetical protein